MIARREEPDYPPIHACEVCRAFRRHEDGRGLCMALITAMADIAERDRALKGTNARNRCRHYRLPQPRGEQR
ncbi:hypothetical protein D769_04344 [Cupriavidus sp. HMR-1]|uniref:hypothetical protein n=1 Tax=Cupriavidus sp. HMR-1 TaxID=1249621 RepID=UPI0002A38F32|nr:hypothetical protein [Cupriavidus sp. HMR-1]ELA00629.1 hypothetical protein D769_04344 [Cupriavidus sp. HMR-1]